MSNFKVGDKVLCVKNHSQGVVVKGEEYPLIAIRKCIKCGHASFDVGIFSGNRLERCAECKIVRSKNAGTFWISHTLFVKADEQDNFASEVLEEIAEKIEVEFIELHNTEGK